MNDHHDEGLDRELKALLSVDPSADLQSKIRRRTTAAPASSPYWRGAIAAGFAFATAIVIAVVLFRPAPEGVRPVAAKEVTPGNVQRTQTVPILASAKKETARRTQAAPSTPRARTQLELMLSMRSVTLVEGTNPADSSAAMELSPLRTIELATAVLQVTAGDPLPVTSIEVVRIEPLALHSEE